MTAVSRLTALDLPVGSVVATSTDVYIRITAHDGAGWHAACSDGGPYGIQSWWIQRLVSDGRAKVLRVGTGG